MFSLLWIIPGFALLFYFLYICIKAIGFVKREYGPGTAIVFVIGLFSMAGNNSHSANRSAKEFAQVLTGFGTGITFYSLESGVQEKGTDGWWRWTSFVHNSESQSGGALSFEAEVKSLTTVPTISNIEIGGPVNVTVSLAGMQLNWGLKVSYSCGLFTGSQYPNGRSANSWYTHEQ
jgi:hypothetical protein